MIPITFVDTNVLMYLADENAVHHEESKQCLRILSKPKPYIMLQNLAEFWHGFVSGKEIPLRENDIPAIEAKAILSDFKGEVFDAMFEVLQWVRFLNIDREPVLDWMRLMKNQEIRARDVHDARLVAAMIDNDIHYMISYDKDFRRYKNIVWLKPGEVIERFSRGAWS